MKKSQIAWISALSIFCLTFNTRILADHIDNFEEGSFFETTKSCGPFFSSSSQALTTGANGGVRHVTLLYTGGVGAGSASLAPDFPDIVDDSVVLGVDSTLNAFFQLDYDPSNEDYLNIPSSPGDQWDRIKVDFVSDTTAMAFATIQSNGNVAMASGTITPGTGSVEFLYSDFVGSPIDFSDIDDFILQLPINGDGTPSSVSISNLGRAGFFSPVPEPTTTILLTLGVVGCLLYRRRVN